MKKFLVKRVFKALLFLVVILLTILEAINFYIIRYASPFIYQAISPVPARSAVLILGAGVRRDGTMSLMLRDRVNTGLLLHQQGKSPKILVSGDHGQRHYDEVNTMRRYLLDQGVAGADIFMDHAGFDTFDS